MREICRTNNPVKISWIQAILDENEIDFLMLDDETASLLGGGIDAVKRRICVPDEQFDRAEELLSRAELSTNTTH